MKQKKHSFLNPFDLFHKIINKKTIDNVINFLKQQEFLFFNDDNMGQFKYIEMPEYQFYWIFPVLTIFENVASMAPSPPC